MRIFYFFLLHAISADAGRTLLRRSQMLPGAPGTLPEEPRRCIWSSFWPKRRVGGTHHIAEHIVKCIRF